MYCHAKSFVEIQSFTHYKRLGSFSRAVPVRYLRGSVPRVRAKRHSLSDCKIGGSEHVRYFRNQQNSKRVQNYLQAFDLPRQSLPSRRREVLVRVLLLLGQDRDEPVSFLFEPLNLWQYILQVEMCKIGISYSIMHVSIYRLREIHITSMGSRGLLE